MARTKPAEFFRTDRVGPRRELQDIERPLDLIRRIVSFGRHAVGYMETG